MGSPAVFLRLVVLRERPPDRNAVFRRTHPGVRRVVRVPVVVDDDRRHTIFSRRAVVVHFEQLDYAGIVAAVLIAACPARSSDSTANVRFIAG